MNRPIRPKDMKPSEVRYHFAERFREAGEAWANAKCDADILEEMKGAKLEKMKCELLAKLTEAGETKVPESRLERECKASEEWASYIRDMCKARAVADKAWIKRKAIEMEETEMIDRNANARNERKMA
jgi:FKBP-type peptidyl-prolyl cis-trans isomerase (trigger factor)